MPHLDGDILSKILILQSVLKFYVLSREQHSIDMVHHLFKNLLRTTAYLACV